MKHFMQGCRNYRKHFYLLDTSSRNYTKDLEGAFEFLGLFEVILLDIVLFVNCERFEKVKENFLCRDHVRPSVT